MLFFLNYFRSKYYAFNFFIYIYILMQINIHAVLLITCWSLSNGQNLLENLDKYENKNFNKTFPKLGWHGMECLVLSKKKMGHTLPTSAYAPIHLYSWKSTQTRAFTTPKRGRESKTRRMRQNRESTPANYACRQLLTPPK